MEAFFDDLDNKIAFLPQLAGQGRTDEARMLCTTYLDGLANWLSPTPGAQRNFSDVIGQHGGEPLFALILPSLLTKSLPWKNAPRGAEAAMRNALEALPSSQAWDAAALAKQLAATLQPAEVAWLKAEFWRGTVASAVYSRIRSLNAHWLGSGDALAFGNIENAGGGLRPVDFGMLYAVLRKLADYAREVSLATNKWFGLH